MIVFWPCRVCSSASRVAGFLAGSQMSLNSFSSLGTRCLQMSGPGSIESDMLSKSLVETHSCPHVQQQEMATQVRCRHGHTIYATCQCSLLLANSLSAGRQLYADKPPTRLCCQVTHAHLHTHTQGLVYRWLPLLKTT